MKTPPATDKRIKTLCGKDQGTGLTVPCLSSFAPEIMHPSDKPTLQLTMPSESKPLFQLTMPSGERIQFGSNVNFVFETDSLQFASPATVSRMGMIFISQEDLQPDDVLNQWKQRHLNTSNPDQENPAMADWIDKHFSRYTSNTLTMMYSDSGPWIGSRRPGSPCRD